MQGQGKRSAHSALQRSLGQPLLKQGKELLGRLLALPSPNAFIRLGPFTTVQDHFHSFGFLLLQWDLSNTTSLTLPGTNKSQYSTLTGETEFTGSPCWTQTYKIRPRTPALAMGDLSAGHLISTRLAVMFLTNIISQQLNTKMEVLRPKTVCNRQK